MIISATTVFLLIIVGAWNVYKRFRGGKPMGMALLQPTKKWRPQPGSGIVNLGKSTDILND